MKEELPLRNCSTTSLRQLSIVDTSALYHVVMYVFTRSILAGSLLEIYWQGVYLKEAGEKRKVGLAMQSQYKPFVDAAIKSQVLIITSQASITDIQSWISVNIFIGQWGSNVQACKSWRVLSLQLQDPGTRALPSRNG